jgi:hypothetical protein
MNEMEDIINKYQDDICNHCYNNITNDIRGANGWLCEGSFCDLAIESFFDDYKYKLRKYKLRKIKNRKNL